MKKDPIPNCTAIIRDLNHSEKKDELSYSSFDFCLNRTVAEIYFDSLQQIDNLITKHQNPENEKSNLDSIFPNR